ncbi:hypothetical protein Ancab_019994 [Ancistrocladus abbreviatus]
MSSNNCRCVMGHMVNEEWFDFNIVMMQLEKVLEIAQIKSYEWISARALAATNFSRRMNPMLNGGFSGGYGCGATPVLIKVTKEFGDERWQPSWAASDMQVAAGMVGVAVFFYPLT